ncbi:MAG TPA: alpha/beta hydrolase-fold protein, partial [Planctomycetia bacterium]|nr:alpha/beta hydrolase-fold protein [Planctomycetia bacterium]
RYFSPVLGQWRDLYVYLPPGYDPGRPCNLVVWFHGSFGDEQMIFVLARLEILDRLIMSNLCAPTIVAIPDCTVTGASGPLTQHSFMVDGKAGRFEEHFLTELLPFIERHYAVRKEREAQALCGVSAGGFSAFSIGLKHRDRFNVVAGLAPPVNLRCDNVKKKYFADFEPQNYRWREDYRPFETVGTFGYGTIRLKESGFIGPVFGPKDKLVENVRRNNPADLLYSLDVKPGEQRYFIRYPKNDNFNIDAQIESFKWMAEERGLHVDSVRDEEGSHVIDYFQDAMIPTWAWLGRNLPASDPVAVGNIAVYIPAAIQTVANKPPAPAAPRPAERSPPESATQPPQGAAKPVRPAESRSWFRSPSQWFRKP